MSSALAIATVTAVLKSMLHDGLTRADASDAIGNWSVTALPPDRIDTGAANQVSHLNLFLHQVSPNAAWRNEGLPSRDPLRGERVSNRPFLALDLHYLLTAFGSAELHAEILLGLGMQVLHETPVLTREQVRRALVAAAQGGAVAPGLQAALAGSDLAEQAELVKLVPQPMSTEEVSKLWAALQARYRPTASYLASLVLIEARALVRGPAPPVFERRVHAMPLRRPVISGLRVQAVAGGPILGNAPIQPGQRLVLDGANLRAEDTLVIVGGIAARPSPEDLADSQAIVALPPGLAAGPQSVRVVHRVAMGGPPPLPHRGVESNLAAFILSPRLVAAPIAAVAAGPDGRVAGTVTVVLDPPVRPGQRAQLLLGAVPPASPPEPEATPPAYGFPAPEPLSPASPPDLVTTIPFAVSGVAPGAYLLRVSVDGADTPLQRDASGRFTGPQVLLT